MPKESFTMHGGSPSAQSTNVEWEELGPTERPIPPSVKLTREQIAEVEGIGRTFARFFQHVECSLADLALAVFPIAHRDAGFAFPDCHQLLRAARDYFNHVENQRLGPAGFAEKVKLQAAMMRGDDKALEQIEEIEELERCRVSLERTLAAAYAEREAHAQELQTAREQEAKFLEQRAGIEATLANLDAQHGQAMENAISLYFCPGSQSMHVMAFHASGMEFLVREQLLRETILPEARRRVEAELARVQARVAELTAPLPERPLPPTNKPHSLATVDEDAAD